jgi:DNA invertase Pin-like site-specific DNA recombinase
MPRGWPLPEEARRQVLRSLSAGKSYSGTAVATGVPRGTVSRIGRDAIIAGRLKPRVIGRAKPGSS